jgi:hypothetical protein
VSHANARHHPCASCATAALIRTLNAAASTVAPSAMKVLKFEGAHHGANEVGTVSLFPRQFLPTSWPA